MEHGKGAFMQRRVCRTRRVVASSLTCQIKSQRGRGEISQQFGPSALATAVGPNGWRVDMTQVRVRKAGDKSINFFKTINK